LEYTSLFLGFHLVFYTGGVSPAGKEKISSREGKTGIAPKYSVGEKWCGSACTWMKMPVSTVVSDEKHHFRYPAADSVKFSACVKGCNRVQ